MLPPQLQKLSKVDPAALVGVGLVKQPLHAARRVVPPRVPRRELDHELWGTRREARAVGTRPERRLQRGGGSQNVRAPGGC
eukprot:3486353-Prymnesium_polylepis.1